MRSTLRRLAAWSALFVICAAPSGIGVSLPNLGPFWVATSGNDSTGDGSQGNPWATIQHARDYVRTNHLNQVQQADITVNVRAGTYAVASPIAFTAADSGYNGHYVVYSCYDGPGTCIYSGGTAVTGWAAYSGDISRAAVTTCPWTLYENGVRSRLARSPNYVSDGTHPEAFASYYTSAANASSNTVLQYNPVDISPGSWTLADVEVFAWGGGNIAWWTDIGPVSARDTTAHTLTLTNNLKFVTASSRYVVEGDLSMLDAAGEWYCDRTDAHGAAPGGKHYLYYQPYTDPIASQTIVLPGVTEVFQVTGTSPTVTASHIKLDGMQVQHGDFGQWFRQGYAYNGSALIGQPSPNPHILDPAYDYFADLAQNQVGLVHLRHTDHVTLSRLHVLDAGYHGIYVDGYGQNDSIVDTLVEHTGLNGIKMQGRYPGEGDIVNTNTIDDFKVQYYGELGGGSNGVELAQSGRNTVSHFLIQRGPRRGIWIVSDTDLSQSWIYSYGNYVHLGKVTLADEDSGDVGGITVSHLSNTVGGPWLQNTFEQIIVDNISAHASMTDAAPSGFFFDNESYNQILTNVQVTNTSTICRNNQSGGHTTTNCSFNGDCTTNNSFDSSQMDTAHIGTIAGTFPY